MRKAEVAALALVLAFLFLAAFTLISTKPSRETTTITLTKSVTVTETKLVVKEAKVLDVCFSATENCVDRLTWWLRRANSSIHVMMYSFTEDELGDALAEALRRGVEVEVVFEENQVNEYSEFWKLREVGVKVYLDGNRYLMHHKVAVIDGVIVVTGSYNWSASAEDRNDENLLIIRSASLASLYEEEFERVKMEAVAA